MKKELNKNLHLEKFFTQFFITKEYLNYVCNIICNNFTTLQQNLLMTPLSAFIYASTRQNSLILTSIYKKCNV